jgi:hypothetical protein
MPFPAIPVAAASLFLKGLSAFAGGKAKKKQQADQNRARTAGLNIQQKQSEDSRRARLDAANSILGRVPATTAGGGVRTGVALDPALVNRLSQERTYDFGSAMPTPGTGAGWEFLSGLAGGAGDTVAGLNDPGQGLIQRDVPEGVVGGSVGDPTTITLEDLMKLFGKPPTEGVGVPMGGPLSKGWS